MAKPQKGPKRVLVVDDEESTREILSEYLGDFGFQVACSANGHEALHLYKKDRFDVVISDLAMSPMDGMELLGEIMKVDPEAIFIMITGYPSIQSAMDAIKKGARDYITKPFNIDEIKLKIDRALLERAVQGRLINVRGIVLALLISIPLWLILGIILARSLK
jgi:two-component system response regulator AtoC